MEGVTVELDELNDSELWELARLSLSAAWQRPIRFRRSMPRERVIQCIETGMCPSPEELYLESRQELERWIQKSWTMVNSQLPCSGPLKGRCTAYSCSEPRHLACYESARPHFKLLK